MYFDLYGCVNVFSPFNYEKLRITDFMSLNFCFARRFREDIDGSGATKWPNIEVGDNWQVWRNFAKVDVKA